jgi:hypothetical protein
MDPFLEDEHLWPSFHHTLIICVRDILQPELAGRYELVVTERRYAAGGTHPAAGPTGEQRESYLEIRHRADGRLITLFEVVSPANKTTAAGRDAYLATRQQGKEARAGLVEVDLVLQGTPTLDYSREGLPRWDHAITVTRPTQPDRYEIYTSTLQKRLPRFRVPLAADDRDAVVDLQTAFERCYDRAGFANRIDYRSGPGVPLRAEDRAWLDEFLWGQGLRGQPAPHTEGAAESAGAEPPAEQVAIIAYNLWEQEGRPHGRDQEHWYRALEQLRRQAGKPSG